MGQNISLFSGYNQKENRTTNYCLLILKMIYEENPKLLSEVLSKMTKEEEIGSLVGVQFRQQEKKDHSVPDGLIFQRSFSIYLEAKNFDWFYDSQLESHLEGLNGEETGKKILIALGNFESKNRVKFEKIQHLCRTLYKGSVYFATVSFEEFIDAIKESEPLFSKNLRDLFSDFKNYLDQQENLLPLWQNFMDVVNCAGLPDEILNDQVYICPAQGGAYNHSRCKFFGMYNDKRVVKIALIESVVDVDPSSEPVIKWQNVHKNSSALVSLAKE